MKKLILFTIFFALFAALNVNAQVYPTLDQRIGKVKVDTLVVGTTAVQVTSHTSAAWVQFSHEDASATVWIGGDADSLTAANGWGALQQYDTTERYPCTNTNIFSLISDEADTKVIMLWGSDGRVE